MSRRWPLLAMAVATMVVTVSGTRPAAAEVDGPCTATVDGVDVGTRSSTSPGDAIRVGEHDVVDIVVEAPGALDHYDVQLAFAGFRWTVASDDTDDTSWRRTVEVDDYSRFGVGLYQVHAVSTGEVRCEGAVLIRVGGNPLATPAGWVALGVTGLGVGAIAASARPGRSRWPVGAMALGGVGGVGAMLLAQQFAVLYPTGTVTAVSVGVGAAAPLGISRLMGSGRGAPAPSTAPPDPVPPSWQPNRVVPPGGLPSYAGPDTWAGPAPHLPEGVEVRVLEHVGARVHVECSNGWQTWLDSDAIGGAS